MLDVKIRSKISQSQKLRRALSIPIRERLNKELLSDLYITKQQSLGDIAKQFRCSRAYVLRLCKEYKIEVRSKGEARIQALKKSKFTGKSYHNVNEKFFNEWSIEMAYVLGFLFADGCLTRCVKFQSQDYYQLQITIMDLDLLNKIKELMKSEHPILPRRNSNGKIIYGITIGREKITQDLIKLGLTPRKSLIAKFPDMPEELIKHFIRGYFDGDGSISFSRNKRYKGGIWKVSFLSGSQNFIKSIRENLHKFTGISEPEIKKHKHAKAYYISYFSQDDIKKLFKYFYDDYTLQNKLYLARKYLKFNEAVDWINRRQNKFEVTP
jgi:hypothetical protein